MIVTTLTALNLERAVFDIMGGFRERTASDTAYQVPVGLTIVCFILLIPLLLCYIGLVLIGMADRRADRAAPPNEV